MQVKTLWYNLKDLFSYHHWNSGSNSDDVYCKFVSVAQYLNQFQWVLYALWIQWQNLKTNFTSKPPKGGRGCLLFPPVCNLRAVIWFHFAIASLVLLPSPVTLSVLSFSAQRSYNVIIFISSIRAAHCNQKLLLFNIWCKTLPRILTIKAITKKIQFWMWVIWEYAFFMWINLVSIWHSVYKCCFFSHLYNQYYPDYYFFLNCTFVCFCINV